MIRLLLRPLQCLIAMAVLFQPAFTGFINPALDPQSPVGSLHAADPAPDNVPETGITEIGSRRELFVDDVMIQSLDAAELRLHHPVRRNVILELDQPWENLWRADSELRKPLGIADADEMDPTVFGYSAVLQVGDLYRLYYTWDRDALTPLTASAESYDGPRIGNKRFRKMTSLTGYAESRDGITWTKPNLGVVEFAGSRDNNLIWTDGYLWDFTPFLDRNPRCKPEERYKTIAGGPPIALGSPDGLRWKPLQDEPVLTDGFFDSQNVAFWDHERQKYVAYYRDIIDGVRTIKYATSECAGIKPIWNRE